MRKDIFMFAIISCHKMNREIKRQITLYDAYQVFDYSKYLEEKGKFHSISIGKELSYIYLMDETYDNKDFDIKDLEDCYNRLYVQKVKKLNKETNC